MDHNVSTYYKIPFYEKDFFMTEEGVRNKLWISWACNYKYKSPWTTFILVRILSKKWSHSKLRAVWILNVVFILLQAVQGSTVVISSYALQCISFIEIFLKKKCKNVNFWNITYNDLYMYLNFTMHYLCYWGILCVCKGIDL